MRDDPFYFLHENEQQQLQLLKQLDQQRREQAASFAGSSFRKATPMVKRSAKWLDESGPKWLAAGEGIIFILAIAVALLGRLGLPPILSLLLLAGCGITVVMLKKLRAK